MTKDKPTGLTIYRTRAWRQRERNRRTSLLEPENLEILIKFVGNQLKHFEHNFSMGRIWHRPVPWLPNKALIDRIEQILRIYYG